MTPCTGGRFSLVPRGLAARRATISVSEQFRDYRPGALRSNKLSATERRFIQRFQSVIMAPIVTDGLIASRAIR